MAASVLPLAAHPPAAREEPGLHVLAEGRLGQLRAAGAEELDDLGGRQPVAVGAFDSVEITVAERAASRFAALLRLFQPLARLPTAAQGGAPGTGENAVVVPSMAAMVHTATDADVQALINDHTLEFAPQVRSLEEGEMIWGILMGYGPQTEFEDKDTGITRIVNTWVIGSTDGRMSISTKSSGMASLHFR